MLRRAVLFFQKWRGTILDSVICKLRKFFGEISEEVKIPQLLTK